MTEEQQISEAAKIVRDGGVIIYPTDTVLGLGCDARNEEAVKRIIAIKQRPAEKSMVILVESEARLNRHVKEVPAIAWDILDTTDKPITIVYPEGVNLAKSVMAEDKTIAIRLVNNEFCEKLIRSCNCALVSTSVNISGGAPALNINMVDPGILEQVDYIVNLPPREGLQKPSPIIKIGVDGEIKIIRP